MWQSAGAAARDGEDGDQWLGVKDFISPWLNCKVRLDILWRGGDGGLGPSFSILSLILGMEAS